MSIKSRVNLAALFEEGDTLEDTSFQDLIDSFVNLADTTAQTIASNLIVPNLAANSLSADSAYITTLHAGTVLHSNPYIEFYSDVTGSVANISAGGSTINPSTSAAAKQSFTQTNGVATYTGTVTAQFSIRAVGNIQSTADHQGFAIIYKNTTPQAQGRARYDMSANVAKQFNCQAVVQLVTNDTISVKIGSYTAISADVEIKNYNVIAHPLALG